MREPALLYEQANILAELPSPVPRAVSAAIEHIYNAEAIEWAKVAIGAFEIDYGVNCPPVVATIGYVNYIPPHHGGLIWFRS